jgi:hypothetical protein
MGFGPEADEQDHAITFGLLKMIGLKENVMLMKQDHCLEIIRIKLMCVSDVTLLLISDYLEASMGGNADFDTRQKGTRDNSDYMHHFQK